MIANRDLAWDGCLNARDLGGLGRVKRGALVRMEAPTALTAAGWAAAWDHGVRTVLDLRAEDEDGPDQTPRPSGITTVRVPLDPEPGTPFHDRWAPIDNLATPLYFPALLEEYADRVTAAVKAVVDAAPGCVVFHCSGGKDRSGLLALVLLAAAGASPDEIIADYLLTFDRMRETYAAMGVRDQLVDRDPPTTPEPAPPTEWSRRPRRSRSAPRSAPAPRRRSRPCRRPPGRCAWSRRRAPAARCRSR